MIDAAAAVSASTLVVAAADPVIAVAARKFEFVPSEIKVRKGRPVTLALTSSDFVHGFSMPDFAIRKDLVPGRTIEVTITPATSGRYPFLCDNFCGEGHDGMSGILVVTDD